LLSIGSWVTFGSNQSSDSPNLLSTFHFAKFFFLGTLAFFTGLGPSLVYKRVEVAGVAGGFSQLALGGLDGSVSLLVLSCNGSGTGAV